MPSNERIGGAAGDEGGLRFVGRAKHSANVLGNMSFKKVVWYDDFDGKAIDNTNHYTVAGVNGGDATVTVPHMMTVKTGGANNDDTEVAMGIEWYPSRNAIMEVRFRIDDVDETGINIGFADATGYSTDEIAMMYATATLTAAATNFVGILHDAAASTSNIYAVSINGGSAGDVIDSTSAPTDAKLYTVRIELVDNGTTVDAVFYLNVNGKAIDPINDYIGDELDAVARTTPLCPYIAIINHDEGAANDLDVDYLKVWQDRR